MALHVTGPATISEAIERQKGAVKKLRARLALEQLKLQLLEEARVKARWLQAIGWDVRIDDDPESEFMSVPGGGSELRKTDHKGGKLNAVVEPR